MIEVYVALSLLGIGYFINKNKKNKINVKDNVKRKVKDNVKDNIKDSDNSFKRNIYESNMQQKVKKDEATKGKILYDENIKQKKTQKYDSVSNPYNKQSEISGKFSNMTHNNMVPFFKGTMNKMQNKSPFLESFTGNSEVYKNKSAVESLFVPQKDITTGMGVNTDLYQGRFQKSVLMNNVTPVPQILVGKGIGQGYDSKPVGGFQQLDERDYVMPRTVDELRAKNNPKLTFEGKIIDGQKHTKRANVPKIDKNKAETFYKNDKSRYFTTTGDQIKQSVTPCIEVKYTTRPDTNTSYKGNAFLKKKDGTHPDELAPYSTFRQKLKTPDPSNAALTNIGKGCSYNHGKDSILIYNNQRDITSEKTYEGNVMSIVKSITSPIVDMLKINKKEYTVEHPREKGHMQSYIQKQTLQKEDIARTTIKETLLQETTKNNLQGSTKLHVYDPNDIARTTIKETLLQETEVTNIDTGRKANIIRNNDKATTTLRETLDYVDTAININSDKKGGIVKDSNDIAKTTIKETLLENERKGNTILNNKGAYTEANYDAKDTNQQYLSQNEYAGNINKSFADGYKIVPTDIRPTQKDELSDNDYYGTAADQTSKEPLSYEAIYNATMNELKEELENNRDPTNTSVKIPSSVDEIGKGESIKQNVKYNPYIAKTFVNQPVYKNITNESVTRERDEHENNRFDPSILGSLEGNPYDIKVFR
jgi:hypothetical protein